MQNYSQLFADADSLVEATTDVPVASATDCKPSS
jgi:hypothetical protein